MGSPIKGRVKRKNPLYQKNRSSFSIGRYVSRQHDLRFVCLFRTRYCASFRFPGVHALMLCNPHQLPIRIKAVDVGRKAPGLKTDSRKSSVPRCVQLNGSQVLWLLTNPFVGSQRGRIKLQKRISSGAVFGCSIFQSGLVDSTPTPYTVHYCSQADYPNNLLGS